MSPLSRREFVLQSAVYGSNGGNRDYAGWKVVGYPGGGHHLGGYSPDQMMGKAKIKTVWGKEV